MSPADTSCIRKPVGKKCMSRTEINLVGPSKFFPDVLGRIRDSEADCDKLPNTRDSPGGNLLGLRKVNDAD